MLPEVPHIIVQPNQPEPAPAVIETVQHVPHSPDQIRAADAVFAQHQDHSVVAGMLGLWSGALLLNDLAKEHFTEPVDEEEENEKKKPKLKEE
jgi:L-ascorbate metabolism protein UlaG (beta-lactamase superfamily)